MYEEFPDFAVGVAREAGAVQVVAFRSGDLGIEAQPNRCDGVTRPDRGVPILAGASEPVAEMRRYVR